MARAELDALLRTCVQTKTTPVHLRICLPMRFGNAGGGVSGSERGWTSADHAPANLRTLDTSIRSLEAPHGTGLQCRYTYWLSCAAMASAEV
eukprot:1885607-Pleurochrysis_carterae.AAC.1